MTTMMTLVAVTLLVLTGVLFALMAIFPALLEIDQHAAHPGNVVHLDSVRPVPRGTDHRPAA
jgi:hypothetical protein